MAQVAVTIAGRIYRVACDQGEEERLSELARGLDARIAEMRARFGEIGDQRLTIMAALTLADELEETRQARDALQGKLAALEANRSQTSSQSDEWVEQVTESLAEAARRIERVTQDLNSSGRGET